MTSYAFLYCRGHRLITVLVMVLFIGFVLAFAEGWLLNIPWLNDTAGANVGTLCSFSYAEGFVEVARWSGICGGR